jgi:hypothetical protein
VPKPFRLLLVRPSPSAGPVKKLGWHEKAARGQVDSSWFVTFFFLWSREDRSNGLEDSPREGVESLAPCHGSSGVSGRREFSNAF